MTGRESMLWGHPSAPEDAPRRSILHSFRMLAPYEEALPDLGFPQGDMAEGSRQFYAFVKELYVQMYGDPGFFLIPEEEYDNYIRDLGGGEPPDYSCGHKADRQELRLRNRFQQAIRFYAAYLYQLGTRAENLEKGVLLLSEAAWKEARKAVSWPHLMEDLPRRFQRLGALGLDERLEPGGVYVTSTDFPKMLYGLWALCQAPDNEYRYMDFLRLDYAAALAGGPSVEGILRVLTPARRSAGEALHDALTGWGCSPRIRPLNALTSGSKFQVRYWKDGVRRAGFSAGPDNITFHLYFQKPEEITRASALVRGRDPKLGAWLDKAVVRRSCACADLRGIELGDGPHKVCGLDCQARFPEPGVGQVQEFLELCRLLEEETARERSQ